MLGTGMFGTVVAAVCCFTPLLAVVPGAVGLSAWLGRLDFVLRPSAGDCCVFCSHGDDPGVQRWRAIFGPDDAPARGRVQ